MPQSCPACGHPNEPNDSRCRACGADLAAARSQAGDTTPTSTPTGDDFIPLVFETSPETIRDGMERTLRRVRREVRHRFQRRAPGSSPRRGD